MNESFGGAAVGLLIFLAVLIIIFLIFREVVCWYWKINQSVALLTEIRDLLAGRTVTQNTIASTPTGAKYTPAPPAAPFGSMGACPNCSIVIPMSAQECPKCKASFGVGSTWQVKPN